MKTQDGHDNGTQDIIACLAVPSRFRLVRAIAEEERCVGELAISVGLSQSCTTRHLQALERAGLIRGERDGRRVRFALRSDLSAARELLRLVIGDRTSPPAAAASDLAAAPRRPSRRAGKLPVDSAPGSNTAASGRGDATPAAEGTDEHEGRVIPAVPRRQEIEDYLL